MTLLNKGAYLLYMTVSRLIKIKIGALGTIEFQKGNYIYVGSAMNNLNKRIDRHLAPASQKKIKWHIDYLLKHPAVSITKVYEFPSSTKKECALSRKVQSKSKGEIKGFGCSDCKCKSHLYNI